MLSGCSSTAEGEQLGPDFPDTYQSVEELKDAFVAAGGDCPEWEQSNHVKAAAESGTCSASNVLSIYTSQSATEDALAIYKSIAQPGATLLVGENWIINDPSAQDFATALGGTFVSI